MRGDDSTEYFGLGYDLIVCTEPRPEEQDLAAWLLVRKVPADYERFAQVLDLP